MITIAIIPLLFGLLSAHARPQAASGGIQCAGSTKFTNGGATMDVAPGTSCVMVDGVATFPGADGQGVVAIESPASEGQTSSSSAAPAVNSGTTTSTGGGEQRVLKPLTSKLKFTDTPGAGVKAACPSDSAIVTASVPEPLTTSNNKDGKRYIAYWSASHGTGEGKLPTFKQLEGVTHLILAHWDPRVVALNVFTSASSTNTEWGLNIAADLRTAAENPELKVMVAMGGWDLDEFFRHNAVDGKRDDLAQLFAEFVDMYQLDGLDMDWEYPVTNGGSYKTTRLKEPCDKDNNILLMQSIRNKLEALKSDTNPIKEYVLSLAVPAGALDGDMSAYDKGSVKEIDKVVDFWNLMSYDAINRRSTKATHHGGGNVIKDTLKRYTDLELPSKKLNIGFPMYAKVFSMINATTSDCSTSKAIGCFMGDDTFENPVDGSDKGAAGAILFRPDLNTVTALGDIAFHTMDHDIKAYTGWARVQSTGIRDEDALATHAFDDDNNNFYTWLTGADMYDSCKRELPNAGGIMAWSLDQDDKGADGGEHFAALLKCIKGE